MKKNLLFRKSSKIIAMTKRDFCILFIIVCIYTFFVLFDLGNTSAPTRTSYDLKSSQDITIDLGKDMDISSLSYYPGFYTNYSLSITTAPDGTDSWTTLGTSENASILKWNEMKSENAVKARYIKLHTTSDVEIFELAIVSPSGTCIRPQNSNDFSALFDENSFYSATPTYREETYFDEYYYPITAYNFLRGKPSFENTHPPMGKIIMSIGIAIFGLNPFGWRIMGALLGILMVPIIYHFALLLFRKTKYAVLTSLIFAFDFMHFTQTRIATIDVYIVFFVILMYYFMYRYLITDYYSSSKKPYLYLGLSGLCMGMGIASKWTGVYAGCGLGVLFLFTLVKHYREYRHAKLGTLDGATDTECTLIQERFKKHTMHVLLFCLGVFILLPIVVYLLAYIPFISPTNVTGYFAGMLDNQSFMLNYHSTFRYYHPANSVWYSWPTIVRPFLYYSRAISSTLSENINAMGNPLVWWIGLPALSFTFYQMIYNRKRKAAFFIISYFAQYLPWFFITRATFIYHYFPCVPFVALMIGYSFMTLEEQTFTSTKAKKWVRRVSIAYIVLTLCAFAIFYPLISGHGISSEFVKNYMRWFPGWDMTLL